MNKVTLRLVAIFLVGAVAIVEAQRPKKRGQRNRIGYLTLGSSSLLHRLSRRHSAMVCANSGISRGKIFTSSTGMPRGKWNVSTNWPLT